MALTAGVGGSLGQLLEAASPQSQACRLLHPGPDGACGARVPRKDRRCTRLIIQQSQLTEEASGAVCGKISAV
jgi:hypothetical protein